VLDVPGVMVGGSQVPNLLQPEEAQTIMLANLGLLSLMNPIPDMPDPKRGRQDVEALMNRLRRLAP